MDETEAALIEDVMTHARRELDPILAKTESPIERVLLLALIRQFGCWPTFGFMAAPLPRFPAEIAEGQYEAFKVIRRKDEVTIAVVAQPVVVFGRKTYRLDFGVFVIEGDRTVTKIALECDGHDFHERTKEQASRDRARDRTLQAEGWKVLRFTGSDIARDPTWCAAEIVSMVLPKREEPTS